MKTNRFTTPRHHHHSTTIMKVYARARSGDRGCKTALPEADVDVPVPEQPAKINPWSSNISNACSKDVCFRKNLDEYRS